MPLVDLKGLNHVRKTLASGRATEYHYAYRGCAKLWDSNAAFKPGTPDYLEAFVEASKPHLLRQPHYLRVVWRHASALRKRQ